MAKKLFEFTALATCAVVVAAETEEQAREAISTWERAWFETGDFIGISDVELNDVREPASQEEDSLMDEAHESV